MDTRGQGAEKLYGVILGTKVAEGAPRPLHPPGSPIIAMALRGLGLILLARSCLSLVVKNAGRREGYLAAANQPTKHTSFLRPEI